MSVVVDDASVVCVLLHKVFCNFIGTTHGLSDALSLVLSQLNTFVSCCCGCCQLSGLLLSPLVQFHQLLLLLVSIEN